MAKSTKIIDKEECYPEGIRENKRDFQVEIITDLRHLNVNEDDTEIMDSTFATVIEEVAEKIENKQCSPTEKIFKISTRYYEKKEYEN